MPRPISEDLRERVVAAVESGEPVRTVAARYDVAVSSVVKWPQRYRKHGHVRPSRIGGYRPRTLDPWRPFGDGAPEANSCLAMRFEKSAKNFLNMVLLFAIRCWCN